MAEQGASISSTLPSAIPTASKLRVAAFAADCIASEETAMRSYPLAARAPKYIRDERHASLGCDAGDMISKLASWHARTPCFFFSFHDSTNYLNYAVVPRSRVVWSTR